MAKNYTQKKEVVSIMIPKDSTIQFILSFSAAYKVIKDRKRKYEFMIN